MNWLLRLLNGLGSRVVTILLVAGVAAVAWLLFLSSQ
jgi:hypothetical protein